MDREHDLGSRATANHDDDHDDHDDHDEMQEVSLQLDRVNCADSAFIIFELLYNCFYNMPHVFFLLSLRCMLCICVFVYLHFCICLFDIWEYHL